MQAWWILPNREQRDDVLASDGEAVFPLRKVLDPRFRPEGFSHGIPAELIERCGENAIPEILFAQSFPFDGERRLFLVSAVAGTDRSGRFVHLGLVIIAERGERVAFRLPYDGLSREDRGHAKRLMERLTSPEPGDRWARSVRELAELPAERPATNVALERSAVRFDALYDAGPGGLEKRSNFRRKQATLAIVLLILFGAASASLYERGCEQRSGVLIWHLS